MKSIPGAQTPTFPILYNTGIFAFKAGLGTGIGDPVMFGLRTLGVLEFNSPAACASHAQNELQCTNISLHACEDHRAK
jgi:hypothetical protein